MSGLIVLITCVNVTNLLLVLFQVKRTDPATYSTAAALLIAVAIAAALIPAARGSRADPVKALRYD